MSVGRLLSALGELLFPPRCQVCGRFCRTPLCLGCVAGFERLSPPWCRRCGRPFDPQAHARPFCPECVRGRPPIDRARSYGLHTGTLREAVNAYKFRGRLRLGWPLGGLLAALFSAEAADELLDPAPAAVVPVPLHPARRRWRGFDQAELLGAALSEALGVPLRADLLARGRNTRPQVGLSRKQRAENVRGAFEVRAGVSLSGERLLLLDDVFTTGATLRECARVLRGAGATRVEAVTVSRRAPDWHPASDLITDV